MNVLLVNNYSTLLDDLNETQPTVFPFQMITHGAAVDIKTNNLGGDGGLYAEEEYLPFW